MFSCSLTVQAGCQRHLSKAVTTYQGHTLSLARGCCDARLPLLSPIFGGSIGGNDYDTICSVHHPISQKRCQRSGRRLSSSRCPLTVLTPGNFFATTSLPPVLLLHVQHSSRSYALKANRGPIPPRPTSRPTGLVPAGAVPSGLGSNPRSRLRPLLLSSCSDFRMSCARSLLSARIRFKVLSWYASICVATGLLSGSSLKSSSVARLSLGPKLQ
jgi:hypothetical protein